MLMVRFGREPFVLRRLTRASREVDDPAWRRLFDEAARHARVGRPVRLLQSAGELMPMTYGTWRPTLVLPASADAWTDDRRRAVLLHELAHVARRDCFVQRLASLACALYWPHPGVWWAARRLRTERELACDDLVLAAGAGPREYAGHLLDLARSLGAVPAPATALGMARARQLEHRLLAVLDAARNRAAPRRAGLAVAVTLALALFVPIAALRATLVPGDAATTTPATITARRAPQEVASRRTGSAQARGISGRRPTRGVVQLTVRAGRSTHGRTVSRAQLEALAGTPIPGNGPVHLPIRREAGTFTVDGVCRNGTCAGTFGFEANAAFGDMLARRGIGRPTPQEQFSLAAADVGTAYLDALTAAGYARPDIQTLVRAAQHGVDLGYVRDMASLGHRLGTLEPLIRLRDHGVDPEYVRGMAALGFSRLTSDELVRARDHGVDPEYVRGIASLGTPGRPREPRHPAGSRRRSGVRARSFDARLHRAHARAPRQAADHGVDPEYIRGMAALGYKGVPIDGLIRMRDHGVDPEYVRRLQQRGSGRLSVDELIQRRDRGDDGSPDAAAREIAASLRVCGIQSSTASLARIGRSSRVATRRCAGLSWVDPRLNGRSRDPTESRGTNLSTRHHLIRLHGVSQRHLRAGHVLRDGEHEQAPLAASR